LRGDLEGAAHAVEQAALLVPALSRPENVWLNGLQGLVAFRLGRLAEAREHAERLAALVAVGPLVQSYCVPAYGAAVEVRLGLLRWDRDTPAERRLTARACAVLADAARIFRWAAPMALLHRGLLLQSTGKKAAAVKLWRRGLDLAQGMALPYDEARLALALADSQGSEAASLTARARRLLRDLDIDTPPVTPPRPRTHRS